MDKKALIDQTKNAFDFIQALYFEVSYLIKEIEGLLYEENERFIIGKPGGYHITNRSSSGLESNLINLWPLRVLSVFFVSENETDFSRGKTTTPLAPNLKVIFLRIVLDEEKIKEPYIICGVLTEFVGRPNKIYEKFEQIIGHIEYNDTKIFLGKEQISYEDGYVKFNGKVFTKHLYDINSSEDIIKSILEPVLKLYRENNID